MHQFRCIDFLDGPTYNVANLQRPDVTRLPADRRTDVSYVDRPLLCRDCGSSFTFTSGEQNFYASRGLQNAPTRCPACRASRRSSESPLGEGYVHYGPFASFGGRSPRQMHPAICSQCGQATEVPFVPKGERPVFCSECFAVLRQSEETAMADRTLPRKT
jgi:CxxC-x17-CxxC domain-containing protein